MRVNKSLKILMVSSEMVPFSKSGGLADVAGALPKYLRRLGHDVRVATPRYLSVKEKTQLPQEKLGLTVKLLLGKEIKEATLWRSQLPGTDVQVILIDQSDYFDRPQLRSSQLYADEKGIDYQDNAFRFAFFSRAVLETFKNQNWIPDVIHCQDWQTALVPLFLKEFQSSDSGFQKTKTVFTFHNANFKGPDNLPKHFLSEIGLSEELFNSDALEYWENVCLLKAGLVFADAVNTVSPTYAREVQDDKPIDPAYPTILYGAGLTGLYQWLSQKGRLCGILNGLDYELWNPEQDKALGNDKFNEKNVVETKKELKRKLQKDLGLETYADAVLIGAVGRIDQKQKGYDLCVPVIEKLASDKKVQIIFLGTGDAEMEIALARQIYKTPKSFPLTGRLILDFNDKLARRIYAGSDMFLMPSRYEPCGLAQMIALRYGSIPIVRATGGLVDTIIDVEKDPEKGNGFIFNDCSSAGLESAIERALKFRRENERGWNELVHRGMRARFSWEESARRYEELYAKVVEPREK